MKVGVSILRIISTLHLAIEILKILLRDETLSPEMDLHTLAKQTETFSGSDLKR